MSADAQVRSRSHHHGKNGKESVTVSPQHVTDPSILDSVAGFISDVVPTAYNVPGETKDQVQWARFEELFSEEYSQDAESENFIPSPLILILGYSNGLQVWSIPATGEAVLLLSWKHGTVKVLKILPNPSKIGLNIVDEFSDKRPLIALCDNATPSPHFCSLSFLSLKTSEQVKLIKFQLPILDVLANRTSVAVTFTERIAVFDAFTLEDKLVITTCYLSPGINPNPVALGTRWVAYAENKLIPSRRSSGGNDGEGIQSYTATVLHAAKSLGRGLREFGETVANSLTGTTPYKPPPNIHSPSNVLQKGIITILDIEAEKSSQIDKTVEPDAIVSHFTAHTEAIVSMCFDPSGMLLLTADKRGHDFHVFRINPHPGGPSLAAVHHLYILHRGDTTAKVQDMCFSADSRWATVSTLRGTTHVFPITPYGGPVGVRTHATPYVVNKMSRFHRSAGLTAEGRSNSPVSIFEAPVISHLPYHNPRLPPFAQPTLVNPLAQVRQPVYVQTTTHNQQRTVSNRQRLSSSSSTSSTEDPVQDILRVCACFAPPRAWILNPTPTTTTPSLKSSSIKPVESLFVMSCYGSLIQYDLDPKHASNVPKEKVSDDTPIELVVRAKAQWGLQRDSNARRDDVPLPLSGEFLKLLETEAPSTKLKPDHNDDRWLSQVEIVTHAGPHRRLWMGPQFTFKTYTTTAGSPGSILESKPIDVRRSKPVNMPLTGAYPVLIEAGSVGSCEPSPKLLDACQRHFDETGCSELQLKEDLADAMLESPGAREGGGRHRRVFSSSMSSKAPSRTVGVVKVVNPLGTVVTVPDQDSELILETQEEVIHENCDEALFRPVVASKAVVFAEPKNVQTKISYSSLHINPDKDKVSRKDNLIDLSYFKPPSSFKRNDNIKKIENEFSEVDSGRFDPNPVNSDSKQVKVDSICDISDADILVSFDEDRDGDVFKPDTEREEEALIEFLKKSENDINEGNEQDSNLTQDTKDVAFSSSEEERIVPKKSRKPKTKLGVRITNLNKPIEAPTPLLIVDDVQPKRSWSNVAATSKIEAEEDEETTINEDINTEKGEFLKINKSSDEEEKVDTTGSSTQTETTTESDDSSNNKVANEEESMIAMDTEEDYGGEEKIKIASTTVIKTNKKKSKKKKR
ncbi:breast carcinoma-amplified sequence 3 homolog isoform X1 [Onthophagus taurus]|uniref:breast carcinoma-amplified sequence 3 homolog isoform X1 n=1 Tax=Onthophagus taurus TaxID=166361 RepID=UPI0039BDC7BA